MGVLDVSTQSKIPSPVSFYGYPLSNSEISPATYDGTPLPFFMGRRGANPKQYREFLRRNQIGRVFDDLEPGRRVYLEVTSVI